MLRDFRDFKRDLRDIVDEFDHILIAERGAFAPELLALLLKEGFTVKETPFPPTAECFARYFYERMTESGYQVARCAVYETADNCAEYRAGAE